MGTVRPDEDNRDEPLAAGRPRRRELRLDGVLFMALFGFLPFYFLWTQYDGLKADRRTERLIRQSPDGYIHLPPFVAPPGCNVHDFRPGEALGQHCQTSANFLGFGWTWTPPWTPEDGSVYRPLGGRSGNGGYYRIGGDVLEANCLADRCVVGMLYRGAIRTP